MEVLANLCSWADLVAERLCCTADGLACCGEIERITPRALQLPRGAEFGAMPFRTRVGCHMSSNSMFTFSAPAETMRCLPST